MKYVCNRNEKQWKNSQYFSQVVCTLFCCDLHTHTPQKCAEGQDSVCFVIYHFTSRHLQQCLAWGTQQNDTKEMGVKGRGGRPQVPSCSFCQPLPEQGWGDCTPPTLAQLLLYPSRFITGQLRSSLTHNRGLHPGLWQPAPAVACNKLCIFTLLKREDSGRGRGELTCVLGLVVWLTGLRWTPFLILSIISSTACRLRSVTSSAVQTTQA